MNSKKPSNTKKQKKRQQSSQQTRQQESSAQKVVENNSATGEPVPNPNPLPGGHGSSGIMPMHSVGPIAATLPIIFSGLIALAQVGADYMAHSHFYETLKHVQERAVERHPPTKGHQESAEKGLIVDEHSSWPQKVDNKPQQRGTQSLHRGQSKIVDESILFGLSAMIMAATGQVFSYLGHTDGMSAKLDRTERTSTAPKEGSRKDPPHPFRRRKRRNKIKK